MKQRSGLAVSSLSIKKMRFKAFLSQRICEGILEDSNPWELFLCGLFDMFALVFI